MSSMPIFASRLGDHPYRVTIYYSRLYSQPLGRLFTFWGTILGLPVMMVDLALKGSGQGVNRTVDWR